MLSVKLEKSQLMLRHSVDIDKQNMRELDEEIKRDKKDIEKNEKQMEAYRSLYQMNVNRINSLRSSVGREDGTDVAGIDDTMSEFSVMSDASDMLPLENILDLKIDEIQFNTQQVNQMLGIDRNVENQV